MRIDLRPVLDSPGEKIPLDSSFDLSKLDYSGRYPVCEPVKLNGHIENSAGVIYLNAKLETLLHLDCDRCATPFQQPFARNFSVVFAETLAGGEEDDDIYLIDAQGIDLYDVVVSEFSLAMDQKFLCTPDCKGICQMCGINLNEGPCSCVEKKVDPRLSALAGLLDK